MSILTPEYIKEQAHKPCFWSEEYGFDVVAFTLAMEQAYSNRVGSKINELKKSATRLEAENARLREQLRCVRDNLNKGMSKSMQKFQAREIDVVIRGEA